MKKQFIETFNSMIKLKYIFVFLVLTSTSCFSQTVFNNLDSLLTKNFEAVNKRDSVDYLLLVNQQFIFKDKNLKSKFDSLLIFKPFTDAFRDLIDELTEMTMNSDFTVAYSNYEFRNKRMAEVSDGQILIHVNLIINNSFSVKMPLTISVHQKQYAIELPMTVMFVESKE